MGLAGFHRLRFNFQPELGEFKGAVVLLGKTGHLGGAGDDFRVAGAHGEIGPGVGTQAGVATLQRKFANQCLKNRAPDDVLAAGATALGRCFAGRQADASLAEAQGGNENGGDQLRLHVLLSVVVCVFERIKSG